MKRPTSTDIAEMEAFKTDGTMEKILAETKCPKSECGNVGMEMDGFVMKCPKCKVKILPESAAIS